MKKVISLLSINLGFLFLTIISLNASSPYAMNVDTVRQGQWVYSGQRSYPGTNIAFTDGNASGFGKLELTEIVPYNQNRVNCSKTGAMHIPNQTDIMCSGAIVNNNNKVEARAKYTNLDNTTKLYVTLQDYFN